MSTNESLMFSALSDEEEALKEKKVLLEQLHRMERKGIDFNQNFSFEDNVSLLRLHLKRAEEEMADALASLLCPQCNLLNLVVSKHQIPLTKCVICQEIDIPKCGYVAICHECVEKRNE